MVTKLSAAVTAEDVAVVGERFEEALPGGPTRQSPRHGVTFGVDEGVVVGHQMGESLDVPAVDAVVEQDRDRCRICTPGTWHAVTLQRMR
jgi:hypothetical protein